MEITLGELVSEIAALPADEHLTAEPPDARIILLSGARPREFYLCFLRHCPVANDLQSVGEIRDRVDSSPVQAILLPDNTCAAKHICEIRHLVRDPPVSRGVSEDLRLVCVFTAYKDPFVKSVAFALVDLAREWVRFFNGCTAKLTGYRDSLSCLCPKCHELPYWNEDERDEWPDYCGYCGSDLREVT